MEAPVKRLRFGVGIALLVLLFHPVDSAFARSSQSVAKLLNQIQSQNWQEREQAVNGLIALPEDKKTDEVKKALILELETELARIQKGGPIDAGEEEYYSELFDLVSWLKDERALPLFIKIGSPTALIRYGDKGVPVIIENLDKATDCDHRLAAVHVLAEVLEEPNRIYVPRGVARQSIKKALLDTLRKGEQPNQDDEWYEKHARGCFNVRHEILNGLGHLAENGDVDVVPVIKSLAENDPFFVDMSYRTDYKGPAKKYLLREEAQDVLRKLQKK